MSGDMTGRLLSAQLAALAFATLATPSMATAASPYGTPAYSMGSAKSRAILGGAPTALERIMAAQSGRSIAEPVIPAALSLPNIRTADFKPDRASSSVWTGRPDLFGTVALKVGHTSLDSRWKRVLNARLPADAAFLPRGLADRDPMEAIEAVNRYVNHRIQFTDDSREFGRPDHWSTAAESLRRGRGDCEDYAIAKMQLLRAAGIPARDLFVVLVRDTVRRSDHAVLVVRSGGRNLLLDNGTDAIFDTESVQDYRPVFTFAATGTWTHGYRRSAEPTITIAEREDNRPRDNAQLASLSIGEPQRSRSASLRAFITGFKR